MRGLIDAPAAHMPENGRERLVTVAQLSVQRGEVLRESFAQPLFVVVAPADRLSPPLMRELMRQKELGYPEKLVGSLCHTNGVSGRGWFSTAK